MFGNLFMLVTYIGGWRLVQRGGGVKQSAFCSKVRVERRGSVRAFISDVDDVLDRLSSRGMKWDASMFRLDDMDYGTGERRGRCCKK